MERHVKVKHEKSSLDTVHAQVPASPTKSIKREVPKIEPKQLNFAREQVREDELEQAKIKVQKREEQLAKELENGSTFVDRLILRNAQARKQRPESSDVLDLDFKIKTRVERRFPAGVEPVSRLKMDPMYVDMDELKAELQDKLLVPVSDFYGLVAPPLFETPTDHNVVLIGIVASKSQVSKNRNGKKMVCLELTDLQQQISVIIQGAAFDVYWKVLQGSVVAILNPTVYLKVNPKTGMKTIGVSLHDDNNSLLELGSASDLGFCKELSKSGQQCNSWINKQKGLMCEYHSFEMYKKSSRQRMDLQSVKSAPFAPKYRGQDFSIFHKVGGDSRNPDKKQYTMDLRATGNQSKFDEFGNRTYMGTSRGVKRKFDLVDGSSKDRDVAKKERLAKEAALRQKLAKLPDGEYFRTYDESGRSIGRDDDGDDPQRQLSSAANIFTPEHVKKLGFNPLMKGPTQRDDSGSMKQKTLEIGCVDAKNVQLGRRSKRIVTQGQESDSEDELEIIY